MVVKKKLTPGASEWLNRNVSNHEIKLALFQMHPDKSPGPDGFNAYFFFQRNWNLIGDEVSATVQSFFHSDWLVTEVNHTLVTLISKISNASHLSDFRPISCCNTTYKLQKF